MDPCVEVRLSQWGSFLKNASCLINRIAFTIIHRNMHFIFGHCWGAILTILTHTNTIYRYLQCRFFLRRCAGVNDLLPALGHFWSKDRQSICTSVPSSACIAKIESIVRWLIVANKLTRNFTESNFIDLRSLGSHQEPHRLQLHDLRFAFRA